MVKVLVTGGAGLVGRYLMATVPKGYKVWGTYCSNLVAGPQYRFMQLKSWSSVRDVVEDVRPDIIIHTAGATSVDWCEKNQAEAQRINMAGTEYLAIEAQNIGAKLVHVSTNAIFDGEQAPYKETDWPAPVNFYGRTKKLSEIGVHCHSTDWIVIRPILLYGWPSNGHRQNWATIVLSKLAEGKTLQVVDDTVTQPTYAGSLARSIWALIEQGATGAYHIADQDTMSLYQFCMRVAMIAGLSTHRILPVPSSYFKGIAPRPRDTTYDLTKMREAGLSPLTVHDGLKEMLDEPFGNYVYP